MIAVFGSCERAAIALGAGGITNSRRRRYRKNEIPPIHGACKRARSFSLRAENNNAKLGPGSKPMICAPYRVPSNNKVVPAAHRIMRAMTIISHEN